MKIDIDDLKTVTNTLIDYLKSRGFDSIDLDVDNYWDVKIDSRFDVNKEPDELVIGQISDDWSELQKILKGENEPISFAFIWLAPIFKAIGETAEVSW